MDVEQAQSNDCLSPIYRRPTDDPAPSLHQMKGGYRDGDLASQRKYYSAILETSVLNNDVQSCILQFVCGYMHLDEVEHNEWDLEEWHMSVMTEGFFNMGARRYQINILDENMSNKTIERIKREIKSKEEGVELCSVWTQDCDDECRSRWTGASCKGQIKFLNLEEPKFLYFVLDWEEHIHRRWRQNKWNTIYCYFIDIRLSTSMDVIEKQEMKYVEGAHSTYSDDSSYEEEEYESTSSTSSYDTSTDSDESSDDEEEDESTYTSSTGSD